MKKKIIAGGVGGWIKDKMWKRIHKGNDSPYLFPSSISLNRMRPQLQNSAAVAQSKILETSSWLLAKRPEKDPPLWAEEYGEKLHYVSLFSSLPALPMGSPSHQTSVLQHQYGNLKSQKKEQENVQRNSENVPCV